MTEFKYEIVENVGVISSNSRGWQKELNFISWNDRDPKFDKRNILNERRAHSIARSSQLVEIIIKKKGSFC